MSAGLVGDRGGRGRDAAGLTVTADVQLPLRDEPGPQGRVRRGGTAGSAWLPPVPAPEAATVLGGTVSSPAGRRRSPLRGRGDCCALESQGPRPRRGTWVLSSGPGCGAGVPGPGLHGSPASPRAGSTFAERLSHQQTAPSVTPNLHLCEF